MNPNLYILCRQVLSPKYHKKLIRIIAFNAMPLISVGSSVGLDTNMNARGMMDDDA